MHEQSVTPPLAGQDEQALESGYEQVAEMFAEVHDLDEKLARRSRYAERVDRVIAE